MASLVLTTVGGAIGGALGGPVGSALGQFGGGFAGSALGLGGAGAGTTGGISIRTTVGPRLTSLGGIASTEGAPISRVYGRARIGGQMIWATRFFEQASTSYTPSIGGKGGDPTPQPQLSIRVDTTYSYSASFAIGLCEGPIAFVRRVWADGQELDLTALNYRVYLGTDDQEPDPLIAAKEASGSVPAYRGLAYIVFEWLPIGPYGNRIPQMTFEVVRPVDGLGAQIRAVNIIPGGTEFGYEPTLHLSFPGPGTTVAENRNQLYAPTDWVASIDALQALCPNLVSVALVVVWFGDDLRAEHCTIAPRVDNGFKTTGADWSVAGLTRSSARLVSLVDGVAAFGGTPSDASVIGAISDLKSRGLSVTFYPFVMMDVAPDNTLPDPWSGTAPQPAFPWRGRITCDPAPGVENSTDGTAIGGTQVNAFFATSGYRQFILHCAALAQIAGGVDGFLVGSELVSLTRVRSAPGVYPAVAALTSLAADVKTILSVTTKISYGADWTEYGAHVLGGGAEIRFPLDAFWSSPSVDFVGIDAYWPLSDWRDGDHRDAFDASTVYDLAYLDRGITGGEAFDWYYVDDEARIAQNRTPISDGAFGKPWVFRQKDIRSWWLNTHVERVGGVETSATTWVAGAKPIWITETGCPAVDRGANGPNTFPSAKSSEGRLPPFSRGFRDDLMQARFVEAVLSHYDPTHDGFAPQDNPVGPGGLRMVDPDRIFLWAWDARPFPAYPSLGSLWADAPDWHTGHWLNGRLEGMPLDRLLAALAEDVRLPDAARERADVEGFLDGYVLDRPMSARAAIEPLTDLFSFDPLVTAGRVGFTSRARRPAITLTTDDLVPAKDGTLVHATRAQETELPHEIALTFGDADFDYAPASVLSRRVEGWSARQSQAESAVMTNRGIAQRSADTWLDDIWAARESLTFSFDPRRIEVEPGDVVHLESGGVTRTARISEITDGPARAAMARALDPAIYDRAVPDGTATKGNRPRVFGPPFVVVLDLAVARNDPLTLQYIAATADPWPGALRLYRSIGGATNELIATLTRKATIGVTLDALPPGPVTVFDRGASVRVRFHSGAVASITDAQALAGTNTFAIAGADGAWEIVTAAHADLVGPDVYRLSRFLRGLGGEEALAQRLVGAGATIVLLDQAVVPLASGLSALGATTTWRIGPAGRDPADVSYVSVTATVGPKALMPYAPVQPSAHRTADGIVLTWTRRGRTESDTWEPIDIPLGETVEHYKVEITRPGLSPRTLDAFASSVLYPAALVLSDFATPPASLDVSIRQLSATVGAGFALATSLTVI